MRYDSLRAFEKYLEETKDFSPFYFIIGKDDFDCQQAIHLLIQFLLPPGQELALSKLDGSQIEEGELSMALYSCSLFTKSRVIWIKQADKLKNQESLEKYIARPPSSQYLLLSASQKNHSLYKALEKRGVILELAEIKPWEKERHLAEWVNKQIAAQRKCISYQVCQLIVKQVGSDQALLTQEIEKLMCYCENKKEITQQDVEAICSLQHVDSIWQLGEAIFRRNAAAAIQIAHAILAEGQAVLLLFRQLRTQFQTELQISLILARGGQPQDVTQEFPYMKGQILDRHIKQVKQCGLEYFKRGLIALDTMERRAKTSSVDDNLLIELLIIQLTQ